jgi:hypothetical protein
MQNISATLYDLRLPYIRGYLPAKNVGSGVKSRIKAALQSAGIEKLRAYGATSNPVILEQRVSTLRKKPRSRSARPDEPTPGRFTNHKLRSRSSCEKLGFANG